MCQFRFFNFHVNFENFLWSSLYRVFFGNNPNRPTRNQEKGRIRGKYAFDSSPCHQTVARSVLPISFQQLLRSLRRAATAGERTDWLYAFILFQVVEFEIATWWRNETQHHSGNTGPQTTLKKLSKYFATEGDWCQVRWSSFAMDNTRNQRYRHPPRCGLR